MSQPYSFPGLLNGKIALITGGGTGIGLAIARAFAAAGAKVLIAGRRVEVLAEACKGIDGAIPVAMDVSNRPALAALVQQVEAEHGAIDILVNNAGINMKKPALEVTDEEFDRVVQTNLNGLFSLTREVGKAMAARGKGNILNITSMAAMYGIPKVPAYTAAKTGVLGLTQTLAVELAPLGIRVNAIAPGFIYSEMTAKALDADPERKGKALGRTPMQRMGQAHEVAAAAVFLCSDAASYINGVNLPVDGGNNIGF